jgi:hypothetical protein
MHPILLHLSKYRRLAAYMEATMTTETLPTTEYIVTKETARFSLVVDPGNQTTAWLAADDAGVVTAGAFPSALSLRGANVQRLLRERGESQLRADEHVITRTGEGGAHLDTYVGALAYSADVWANTRGSADRYSDVAWNLYLFQVAAALAAPNAKRISANIVTMLPPGLWASQQAAVRAMLVGEHRYNYNGREIVLTVRDVAVEREGHAAWWALPADERSEGLSLVFDWGGGTVNALLVEADGTSERKPVTFDGLGLETVLDDVSADLARPLSIRERESLKDALRDGTPFSIYADGGAVDVAVIARARLVQAAQQIGAIIKPKFSAAALGALRRIYLIGGTAYVAADAMRAVFSRVQVPTTVKPELLNVVGAATKSGLISAAPDGALVGRKKGRR